MEVHTHNRTFYTMHNKNLIRWIFFLLNSSNCLTILHARFFCAKVSLCNFVPRAILYACAILRPTHVSINKLFF